MVFGEGIGISGDVPKIEVGGNIKETPDIRADIRGRGDRAPDNDDEYQHDDFASAEYGPALRIVPRLIVVHQLQQSPGDDENGPIAGKRPPDRNHVTEIARQQ